MERVAQPVAGTPTGNVARLEEEANRVALAVSPTSVPVGQMDVPEPPAAFARDGLTVDATVAAHVAAHTGTAAPRARILAGPEGDARAREARAWAVTEDTTIAFRHGAYRPDLPLGRALLAHELAHASQFAMRGAPTAGASLTPARSGLRLRLCDDSESKSGAAPTGSSTTGAAPTGSSTTGAATTVATPTGAAAAAAARTSAAAAVGQFDASDQLRRLLDEMAKGKSLAFARAQGPKAIRAYGGAAKLTAAAIASLETEFTWLVDNAPPTTTASVWAPKRTTFEGKVRSSLATLSGKRGSELNTFVDGLANTPERVFEAVITASRADVPPAMLYACAVNEGLIDVYVRSQTTNAGARLTSAELAGISTSRPVDGFQALGLDDFYSDLDEKTRPLAGYLPPSFDLTKMREKLNVNERERTVRSINTPDLVSALQAKAAVLARRRDFFDADRASFGYPAPTGEQYVYFTYVYYNSGIYEGKRTLKAHAPGGKAPRALGDWITKGEYPKPQIVLRTYKAISGLGILKGY